MNKKPVILIVDDLPSNIELLEAFLATEDYRIVKAESGREALKMIADDQIDLVLLDVMMADINGFDVLTSVRKDEKHRLLPIILVTALRETEERIKGIEAGCDDFLSKPVDKLELLTRVRSLLKVKAYNDLMDSYRKELEAEVVARTAELALALERIKAASMEMIYRLSISAEYKDEDGDKHIKRVNCYIAAVARHMGLGESTINSILNAEPLDEIGKIGVIEAAKPMVADIGFISIAETIALCRQERWDGSGYPNGLKGKAIPITGRIAAVASAFDALTSKRPFNEPISVEKALALISEWSGSKFDPQVVDAFLSVKDDILGLKKKYDEFNEQIFEIPELKALLQQFKKNYHMLNPGYPIIF